jgi:hypothetical protein
VLETVKYISILNFLKYFKACFDEMLSCFLVALLHRLTFPHEKATETAQNRFSGISKYNTVTYFTTAREEYRMYDIGDPTFQGILALRWI